jgi:uncharacterized protein (TIGR03083 family)
MEISQHIAAIERDGELMAAAARASGLQAAVPSCAPWQVRDLLRHQGYVHRWAADYVGQQLPEPVPDVPEAEILASGPPDDGLLAWFTAGYQALADTLRTADPAVRCWTFLPAPSPLAFWARRQAHETAVHRADAQLAAGPVTPFAAGPVTPFAADFAADGIDELIMGFLGRRTAAERPGQRALYVAAADAAADWLVTLTPDEARIARVERGGGPAAATLTGSASALYLLLWNRAGIEDGAVSVEGDADLVKSWSERVHVTWG